MGVDTVQNLIWNRIIYRLRQIIPKTFFSEIDAHSMRLFGSTTRVTWVSLTDMRNINNPALQAERFVLLSGVPDYFGRNKISSGGDLSHYSSASLY